MIPTITGTGDEGSNDALKLRTNVLFHERITADTEGYGGIHPLVALYSHQRRLAPLVQKAIEHLEPCSGPASIVDARRAPDFVTVTRGPGMRSNLSVGLDTAKGLAVAWNVPLVGVHHMQAHALTPRLCSTIRLRPQEAYRSPRDGYHDAAEWTPQDLEPRFPFLSVLASGGHTMLIESNSLIEHKILAATADIAIGDCLDKAARAILPSELLVPPYGRALEEFAFPNGSSDYHYIPPAGRREELERRETRWGWSLGAPLSDSHGAAKSSRRMLYSFAGLLTYVQRIMTANPERSIDERRELAAEVMRVAFEHLASRIMLHLSSLNAEDLETVKTVVLSGGVASNKFLKHVIRSILDVRNFQHIRLVYPPPELCTDNALMIAWLGMEMYDAGYESELGIQPLRKWSMDAAAEDGGILGAGGWMKRTGSIPDVKL
ncbi:Mitochondrial tRNAs modification protein [Vermiconidia calcicola]|uniref:Mitochondrial tRNAs modification protein n=1 Tax=Vermiconidia calcicola TaxID=1690605 RepID=A0ACC3N820_9PEZI|nr:Mitochondrial tRNAs modification protein [Vermiconidia calcicola]